MSAITFGHVFVSLRSFIAESEQMREQWVDAMRNAIGEALSNSEVAEQIWGEPSNSFCADCSAPKPDWAAINLCVVICKRCAGLFESLSTCEKCCLPAFLGHVCIILTSLKYVCCSRGSLFFLFFFFICVEMLL